MCPSQQHSIKGDVEKIGSVYAEVEQCVYSSFQSHVWQPPRAKHFNSGLLVRLKKYILKEQFTQKLNSVITQPDADGKSGEIP